MEAFFDENVTSNDRECVSPSKSSPSSEGDLLPEPI